ncbi:hypothetical protein BGW38_002193 [Lunasporangiospora selenospora]|uniref:Uncharacterized protein n=1 Tax=Lunasporangiospora selenospora TaxID=979761 RepID=A0A9P6KI08_9FUNG|nr:hypothetical protein BGW38_002193 [Lunasporangiospora selenospora]
MPPHAGSTAPAWSRSLLHFGARVIRTSSSRLLLGLVIILIALLSFSSVLFSGTPSNDIYYPDAPPSQAGEDQYYNPDPLALLEQRRPMRHSYQELYKLPSKFMLNEDGTAPVTAIIHPQDFGPGLTSQIRALLAQTDQPQAIWITVSEDDDFTAVKDLISSFSTSTTSTDGDLDHNPADELDKDNSSDESARIKMRIVSRDDPWWSVARQASSEFFLLLDDGVVPGNAYLGTLLRLAHTPEYSRSLLGSHGAVLNISPDNTVINGDLDIKCLPDRNDHGLVRATESVDVLTDIWFGRTETLQLMSLEPYEYADKAPLSIYLSTLLRYYGSIQSIVVANDPRNIATWGDTRKKDQAAAFCSEIQNHYKESRVWHSWIERGKALVAQHERLPSLVIFVADEDEAMLLKDLICRWSLSPEMSVHVAVPGTQRGLGRKDFASLLPSEGCHVGVYDLRLSPSSLSPTAVESARLTAEVTVNAFQLLHSLRPKSVFYLQESDSAFSEGLDIVMTRMKIPAIALRPEDIEHVQWLSDLSVRALENWNTPQIKLIVITNNRPGSCARLLRSLSHAHYLNDKVTLTINMDAEADRMTLQFVGNFQWDFGEKLMRHRVRRGGLMLAVVEAWYPHGRHEYAVLLEDDVEVSPLFYTWIKYNILRYRYSPDSQLYQRMFGVSMYSQKFVETHLAGRAPFNPEDIFIETPEYELRTPFLLQLPCSWGAVYFPEHWREFHEYVTDRLLDIEWNKTSLQSVQIPNSRTNRWSNSWKKLFIEMIYMRGYVMLYPNYFNFTSFSTNHLEWGTHTKQQRNSAGTFLVPLMTDSQRLLDDLPNRRLPNWDTLPVLDLWANLATSAELIQRGRSLQEKLNPGLLRNSRDEVIWEGQEKQLKCPKTLPYYSTHTTPMPKTTTTVPRVAETLSISAISPALGPNENESVSSPSPTPASSNGEGNDVEKPGPSPSYRLSPIPSPTPSS